MELVDMSIQNFLSASLVSILALTGLAGNAVAAEVVTADDIEWTPLNPLRGDASPQAATLWGNRGSAIATGFLVRFRNGFSSPPHIHNVTYRGVVINGLIHNDDPDAAKMWMPAGSYWTQPAGEVHITAANADENVAYIEIGSGPYLVRPPKETFDNGERPINVDASNLVWLDIDQTNNNAPVPQQTYLWGPQTPGSLNGTMLKLPKGYTGELRSDGSSLKAVTIAGELTHQVTEKTGSSTLLPGSFFSSQENMAHRISCMSDQNCLIYLRSQGLYDLTTIQ
ncbi:MAG: DUF4437 domain-containing protein [Pseudomonadota bacterium]